MPEKKTVLVIEDEPSLQEALKLKLGKAGVEVFTASSGEEALEVLKTLRPTLVSLDLLLPKINGLEVLRQIRQNPETANLPVIVVSVSGGNEKLRQAFSFNVVDYIIKSEYTIEEIVKKLKEVLKNL
ncbi:MAG: hypothetical protein UX26_C0002G0006 [Parcubacteria group bacterium GW2011_GWC1_45_9]|nr:MAG: hypothetical protein UW85_C0004G0019 [Parcubacteria group bacterium GW2011_GWA1_Parcubacteria_45_10]KKT89156.1 MAG: hypothetical protein UW89_C0002G0006 [Parcubacteria group bacterium GW2011_GWB1_45_10]KKU17350.1 MAG: hypothetical protein UX26_C0002G0006 [Parcubacteria group bacterium GW2011_GWC1_45_9]HCI05255.1 hypothetical protein [Patescibacteria group bacterium]